MAARGSSPNILLILVDDMGYGDFSAFNGGMSRTPRLDQLLEESVCLSQHYTASPVCNPSRAALLTGRYPHRTGSVDTLEWRGLERLALREITLADMLRGAGYRTGLVGKWHLGAFDPRYHPNARGFEEAVCFRGGMHDYYRWRLEYDDTVRRADGRYLTHVWAEEAVGFIDRHHAEPFFLHVTFNAPHTPLQAPPEAVRPFAETGRFTPAVSTLYGMIAEMDRAVERILDSLDRHGIAENTLVLFSSDNGPQFGGVGDDDLTRFNCNLNGSKGLTYEGGIRVPAIVRWPAELPAGRDMGSMVHFCDWFPTLLAAAGIAPPAERAIDGLDILPYLRGRSGHSEPPRFWQWNRYTPMITTNAAIRDGDWKLIRPVIDGTLHVSDIQWLDVCMYHPETIIENGLPLDPLPPNDFPPPPPAELYDLLTDPGERNNLAAVHPDRTRKMEAALESWFEDVEADRAAIDDVW